MKIVSSFVVDQQGKGMGKLINLHCGGVVDII